MKSKINESIICKNKKASFEYFILDKIEAGIVLQGWELKSLLYHKSSIDESYATIINKEIWLINCNIEKYKNTNDLNVNTKRKRKLLLNHDEIIKFAKKAEQQGHTIIPLKLYFNQGKVKVELAVCKGKKNHDKRQANKLKEHKKEIKKYSI